MTLIACLLLLIAAGLSFSRYDSFQVGVYGDDAYYITQAQALVYTGQHRLIHVPGEQATALFPPGYPLLLAPLVWLFPNNFDVLRWLSLTATLLNAALLIGAWPSFSRRSRWWGLAIAGLYLLAPLTVNHSRMVMSEAAFTTFYLAATWLAVQAVRRRRGRLWRLWACLAVTVGFVLIRTAGLIMAGSLLAYLALAAASRLSKWRRAAAGAALLAGLVIGLAGLRAGLFMPQRYLKEKNAALLVSLYVGVTSIDPEGLLPAHYLKADETLTGWQRINTQRLFGDYLGTRLDRHLFQDLQQAVLPIGGGEGEYAFANAIGWQTLPRVISSIVLGLTLLGYLTWLGQERFSIFRLSAGLYFGGLLLWDWVGPRLLYPIQPQLYLSFLIGIESVVYGIAGLVKQPAIRQAGRAGFIAATLGLIVISAYQSASIGDSRQHVGDLAVRTAWLKASTPPSAILMTEYPATDYLYSGRKSLALPASPGSADELLAYLIERRVDYVLLAPMLRWQTSYTPRYTPNTRHILELALQLSAEGRLTRVYTSAQDGVNVFQVRLN